MEDEDYIKVSTLKKLPPGKFLGFDSIPDQGGGMIQVIKWSWNSAHGVETAFFTKDGEYLSHYAVLHNH